MVKIPEVCKFRGIKIYINWRERQPPHFHATYGGEEVLVSIRDIEELEGSLPNKQLKMLLGWAAFHQEERELGARRTTAGTFPYRTLEVSEGTA